MVTRLEISRRGSQERLEVRMDTKGGVLDINGSVVELRGYRLMCIEYRDRSLPCFKVVYNFGDRESLERDYYGIKALEKEGFEVKGELEDEALIPYFLDIVFPKNTRIFKLLEEVN